ncbi:MAG: hypothetical protein K0S78_5068, partial [Thermomicrobiales bacterium]|nr:hypothetical protein [Thermomicrobiales bacterium]
DWNELVEILERRHRAETVDTVGRSAVPRDIPGGFEIALTGGGPTIGPGRIYVDGLLAENHGQAPAGQTQLDFDPVLAELRGSAPLPYNGQPYLPNAAAVAPFPAAGGPHLVYLDVWQRELTYLEEPDLVENAVGVDTTTRAQTAWQVRVLPNVGTGITCDSPDGDLQGWLDLIAPSAGRLTTAAVGVAEEDDPCLTPPSGGYKGLENHLYRVEIHDGGGLNDATFKWSRDNASVATTVTSIPTANELVVTWVRRDAILRFSPGDWIEITDDWRELAGLPGIMALIENVDDATRTLTLDRNLPAGTFPTDATNATDPARHTRIRRWDHRGRIDDSSGALLVNLDAAGSDGVIPLPPAGRSVTLENGVQVTFTVAAAGGEFRSGDYWTFAARTADASVEELAQAPPRGVHHHYCRLAIVTLPNDVQDCRTIWPPEIAGAGCDCTACVDPESHNSGVFTIQQAINEVRAEGGKVCLAPGQYVLRQPVRIEGARSLLLQGKGWLTQLAYAGDGPAIVVANSTGVTLEAFMLTSSEFGAFPASVLVRNSPATTIQRCVLFQVQFQRSPREGQRSGALIGLSGVTLATVIRENMLMGAYGIASVAGEDEEIGRLEDRARLISAELAIEDNLMRCRAGGILLAGATIFLAETRIAGNVLDECEEAGIVVIGRVGGQSEAWRGSSHIEIRGNTLSTVGEGIRVGTNDTRILDNDIGASEDEAEREVALRGSNGIALAPSPQQEVARCQILGNRIRGLFGHGIAIATNVRSLMIKQNVIARVGGDGIHMEDESVAEVLSIENNHLSNIAPTANDRTTAVAGIRLTDCRNSAIAGNVVSNVGQAAVENPMRSGIIVERGARSVRISGNEVERIGPNIHLGAGLGIGVILADGSTDVLDNVVRRGGIESPEGEGVRGDWFALVIVEASGERPDVEIDAPGRPQFGFAGRIITVAEGRTAAVLFPNRAFVLDISGRASVGARGNVLSGYGDTQLVFIVTRGACVFSENRCVLELADNDSITIVNLRAESAVVSGNVINGSQALTGLRISAELATVLGNIAAPTRIILNGAPLPDPWAPLNVF